jgi:S1-C subfamily serine protease
MIHDEPRRSSTAEERHRERRRPPWWFVAFVVVAVAAVAIVVVERGSSGQDSLSPAEVDSVVKAAVDKGVADAAAAPPHSAVVYQAIYPSLVYITADREGTDNTDERVGTGIIVNEAGAILTARHVVAGAGVIHVTFADGTQAVAQIASAQPENDIAVLVADRSPGVIVPAVLGSTGGLQVGDEAFAVGHPFGLVDSLSAGVISGLDRTMPAADGSTLKGLIQFDAAVNPGNSGGPLLNRDGQVIGIVTALANPSQQGVFIGIGFAVPIGTASGAAGGPEL